MDGEAEGPPGEAGWAPVLGDRTVVALAVAVAAGAWFRWSLSVPLSAMVMGAGVWLFRGRARRPVLAVVGLALALALLAAALADRAYSTLVSAKPGPVEGTVSLVTDPQRWLAGTWAVARFEGERVRVQAHGAAGRALARALAGDRVELRGQRRGMSADQIGANPWRRVVGAVDVDTVVAVRPGPLHHRLANEIHRRLSGGARSLPDDQRALLSGLVLGDDRAQPPVLRHAFDAVGLSHLLAVSGQNVAFVLAAAGPLLRRMRLGSRWVAIVVLLVFFATVTRFEPSVLRAVAMAALATIAAALGRPTPGLRVLSWAVIGLVLADPLLVRSLGFQLSVAASAGILLLSPPMASGLQRYLALPAWVAAALTVPLAAQLATAPLLVSRNGPLPLVAVPANMAVGGAAGLLMTWGSSAGVLAGWLPGPLAWLVHLPSRALLWWISQVALVGERWSTVGLSGTHLAVLIALAGLTVAIRRYRRRATPAGSVAPNGERCPTAPLTPPHAPPLAVGGRTGVAGGSGPWWWGPAVGSLIWAALLARSGSPPVRALPQGVTFDQRDQVEVVVLAGAADPTGLLRNLRARADGSIELLVVTSPSRAAWEAATAVREVIGADVVLTSVRRPDASMARHGQTYQVGPLLVTMRDRHGSDRLEVVVTDLEAIPP
ncbi:MAG: ComEC/Rec2 family competence protein [Acidimicrobiales bacterium]